MATRTPCHVATYSTGALMVTVIIVSVVRELSGSPREGVVLDTVAETALGSLFLGALVWSGAYIGARFSAPDQRSDRFVRTLALIFIVLGLLLSLPIVTHAVRLDMPTAAHPSSGMDWRALLMPLGALVLIVVIPLVVTRFLVATFGRATR